MNYYCGDCQIVSGIVIDFCGKCSLKLNFKDRDLEEYSDEEEIMNIKYQIEQEEEERKKIEQEIRKQKADLRKKKREAKYKPRKNKFFAYGQDYDNLTEQQQQQQDILERLLANVQGTSLKKYYRTYAQTQKSSTRGPRNIPQIQEYCSYKKPEGYIGIPLEVKEAGDWLGKSGKDDEWFVAYHGTSMKAVESILKQGFKAGPRQAHAKVTSNYPLTNKQRVGSGIYCSPRISTASSYSKGNFYTIILQCRVNPKRLKIADKDFWILNNSQDIIPYRLLIR